MIQIKNKSSIAKMEEAGSLLSGMFEILGSIICVGVATADIDAWIEKELKKRGLLSRMKGYMGYQHVSCISLNNEVVHGVPSARKLKDGDFLTVDVCASYKGYCADMARQFFVGTPLPQAKQLAEVAQKSLDAAIAKATVGNRLSDISAAVQQVVERAGFGVVRDFAGHGIGKQMHEDPEILNYGTPGQGPILRPGMAFAIEPMITAGRYEVYVTADGWTVCTEDNSLAAHVEDTVVITESGPKVITRNPVHR
jgi:methionyl aminopeptidase